jgi:glucokinase
MITQPDTGQKSSRASYADGPRLLADIGATHARFTLETAPGVFRQTAILRCDDYDGIVPLLNAYLTEQRGERITHAAFAMANPVSGDLVRQADVNRQPARDGA